MNSCVSWMFLPIVRRDLYENMYLWFFFSFFTLDYFAGVTQSPQHTQYKWYFFWLGDVLPAFCFVKAYHPVFTVFEYDTFGLTQHGGSQVEARLKGLQKSGEEWKSKQRHSRIANTDTDVVVREFCWCNLMTVLGCSRHHLRKIYLAYKIIHSHTEFLALSTNFALCCTFLIAELNYCTNFVVPFRMFLNIIVCCLEFIFAGVTQVASRLEAISLSVPIAERLNAMEQDGEKYVVMFEL